MWRKIGKGASILAAAAFFTLPASPLLAEEDDVPALLGEEGDFSLAPPEMGEDDVKTGWYLRAGGGYLMPHSNRLTVDGTVVAPGAASSGWSVGGGLGYRFTDWMRAEASLDYLSLGRTGRPFASFSTSATVALANLYLDLPTWSGFTPYVGGGLGFAVTALDAGLLLPAQRNDTRFAWSLATGVSYAIDASWAVDFGYRYISLGSPDYPGLFETTRVDTLGTHELRLTLRYQFGG